MNRIPLFASAILFFSAPQSRAQLPNSNLEMISPAFARAGTEVEVNLSGKDLEELTGLRFNDARIVARQKMLPVDDFFPKPRPDGNRFVVTIPGDLPPGIYEARSLGYFGLSTARPFMVLPKDAAEMEESSDHSKRENALSLPIETGLTGTIDAGNLDWFQMKGKKGERLLIEVWAERLDSKLDGMLAVYDQAGRELESNRQHFGRDPFVDFTPPADGEYWVSLADILYRGGSQYFYRIKVSRGPHIDFVFPPAGLPGKKTKFTLYGRNLPGGSLGEGVKIGGKLLESVEVEIQMPSAPSVPKSFTGRTPREDLLPAFEYRYKNSNPVRIGFATAPVVPEDSPSGAPQKVSVPCEVAGRFDQPGDSDAYRFMATRGTSYWIESISQQMTAATDTVILLRKIGRDETGKETVTAVSENDERPSYFSADRHDSSNADTNDAVLSFTADADAEYEIKLINNLGSGDPAHQYRLAIRNASPDFQLLTTTELNIMASNGRAGFPAAQLVRRGGSIVYRVIAPRRDGFDGDIVITMEGLPKGVNAQPLVFSGQTDNGFLTVLAAPDAPAWAGPVRIVGKANIHGKEIVRTARNASLVWGSIFADSYRVRTRLDLETVLSVTDRENAPALVSQADPAKKWEVELNQKLDIPVKVTDSAMRKGNLTVQVHGFPGMLRSPPNVAIPEKAKDGKITIDFKPNGNFKVESGRYQFVLQGIGIAKYPYNPGNVKTAQAEKDRLETLARTMMKSAATAKTKIAPAEKELAAAKADAASTGAAEKASLAKRVAELQARLDGLKKASAEAEAKSKKAADYRTKSEQKLKTVTAKAKEKDVKFATFSQPISVEVKEKPKPAPPAKVTAPAPKK